MPMAESRPQLRVSLRTMALRLFAISMAASAGQYDQGVGQASGENHLAALEQRAVAFAVGDGDLQLDATRQCHLIQREPAEVTAVHDAAGEAVELPISRRLAPQFDLL